jgi:class 3 adenylate cyclase/tetratricopeptide (TPR) repeat protein
MLPVMTCAVCGEPLPEGARFCPNCGALVATPLETQERKMVTVLFADLVDSTGLAQRIDPERARDVFSRFFDAATEELLALRGRPEKFIGDAVMAVFGLPHVHEDDALRAIRAGFAIGGRVRRLGESLGLTEPLEVRVGIESGEAATGIGPAGQLLVTGTVVNAAARLQSAAAPGEVLTGRTTHALTNTAVEFGPRRDFSAKGFDDDMNGFPVEGLTTRSARRTIPFVGRTNELTILRDCVTRSATSGRPVLATVVGESGIGKSRLADELVAGLGSEITVLIGRARSYTDTATFAPAAAIIGDLAGIDGDEPEKVRQRLAELVEECCKRGEPERIVDRLARMFQTSEHERDESAFVHDVQAGFTAVVDGLCDTHPVVLVFEDVQSLKPPMLDLIERLGSHVDGIRRRVAVALARPELLSERPTWGSTAENAVMLRLQSLPQEEAVELVRQAGGGKIEESEATSIASRTGGNPFFIVETTGMLLPGPDGVPADVRGTLPPTVQAVVAARLDALPARLRELARRASVFFYSFDLDELSLVDKVDLHELRLLEEAEILVRDEGRGPTPRWRVRHATLREVAYASLPKRERLRLHDRISQNLLDTGHPSWAADHLELAALASLDLAPDDREIPERAADLLLAAGDRSRRRIESRSAVDFYQRALALAGPETGWGVREARALAGMGEARYWLGEYPAATEALNRALSLGESTGDAFSLALALRFLGDISINVDGDLDTAEQHLDRSLTAAEELGDPWVVARTLLFAGWVPWTRRRYEEAEEIWKRALATTEDDDYWARTRALTSLSINRESMNDFAEALRLIEEASDLADESGDRFSEAVTRVQKARVFEDMERFEESLSCFDRGIAIFEELGARWELADATAERGIAKRELGRLDEAEEDLRHAIRISDELGERQLASWTWRALARVAERRGDQAEAEERFRRAEQAEARRPQ